MPTRIAAVMPCLVVRFQKSSITSAGRLAEAATLNAQPTRKRHVHPLEEDAEDHRDDADDDRRDLAGADLGRDRSSFIRRTLVSRSWATAPLAAMIRPLTVPSTVVKAIAEMIANSSSLKLLASSGAAMLVLVTSRAPLVIAPRPRNSVST